MGLWYGGNSPTELCGGSKCPVVDNPVFGHHVKNWGNNKIRVVSLRNAPFWRILISSILAS